MKRVGIIFFLIALFACSKEGSLGTLSFTISGESVVLEETKALSDDLVDAFTISIPESDFATDIYGNIKGKTFEMALGDYTAYAENCSESDTETGYGCVRYSGSCQFTISANQQMEVVIPCSISNSKVSVLLKPNFLSFFDISQTVVSITALDRELTFQNFCVLDDSQDCAVAMESAAHLSSQYAYYLPGRSLSITVSSKRSGSPSERTTTYSLSTLTTQAQIWHKLYIDADLNSTSGGIEITVGDQTTSITNGFSIDGYTDGSVTED